MKLWKPKPICNCMHAQRYLKENKKIKRNGCSQELTIEGTAKDAAMART